MIEHSRFRLLPMIGLHRAARPCVQNLLDSCSAKVRQCFDQQSLSIGCERLAQYQCERHGRFTAARQLRLHINQHQCCNRIDQLRNHSLRYFTSSSESVPFCSRKIASRIGRAARTAFSSAARPSQDCGSTASLRILAVSLSILKGQKSFRSCTPRNKFANRKTNMASAHSQVNDIALENPIRVEKASAND
mgnify:CR=1 FL=1